MSTSYATILSCSLLALCVACGDDVEGSNGDTDGSSSTAGNDDASTTADDDSTTGAEGDSTTMEPDTTSAEGSSTGSPIECGNGEVEEGEECDDSDLESDDACRADCTIPYEVEWTLTENGPEDGRDNFVDITVLDDGNLLVLGTFDNGDSGQDVWLRSYGVDGTAGSIDFIYDAEGLDDVAAAMVPSSTGVVIALTSETDAGEASQETDDGIVTLAVSLEGEEPLVEWTDRYDGPGTDQGGDDDLIDVARGVTVDADGNVYVIGHQRNDTTDFDIVVRKLDAMGQEQWVREHDGPNNRRDFGDAIALGPDGNVWALGSENFEGQTDRVWLRIYDAEGAEVATQTFDFSANDLAFDSEGNLVLTGFDVDGGNGPDFTIRKYDGEFAELWSYSHNGPAGGGDSGVSLVVDAEDSIYATGSQARLGEQANIWTMKLDAEGQPQWGAEYNNPDASLDDVGLGIAVDAEGRVFVAGRTTVLGQGDDAWLTAYLQL